VIDQKRLGVSSVAAEFRRMSKLLPDFCSEDKVDGSLGEPAARHRCARRPVKGRIDLHTVKMRGVELQLVHPLAADLGIEHAAPAVGRQAGIGIAAGTDKIARMSGHQKNSSPIAGAENASDIPILANSKICNANFFHLGYLQFHAHGNSALGILEVSSSWQR